MRCVCKCEANIQLAGNSKDKKLNLPIFARVIIKGTALKTIFFLLGKHFFLREIQTNTRVKICPRITI